MAIFDSRLAASSVLARNPAHSLRRERHLGETRMSIIAWIVLGQCTR